MGCPMCEWKTALLMLAGFALLLAPLGVYSYLGLAFIITAWVWAMWPKKSCAYTPPPPGGPGGSPRK